MEKPDEHDVRGSARRELARRPRRDLVSRAWRQLAGERRVVVGLAALAVVAAQAESAAIIFIALIAESVARGSDEITPSLGPLDTGLSVVGASVTAIAMIAIAAAAVLAFSHISATAFARLEASDREEVVSTYGTADWEYQSTLKSSRLQGRLLTLMDARAVAFTGLVGWIRALATIVVFVTVAAAMNLVAAGVMVVFGLVLSLAVLPLRRRIVRFSSGAAESEVSLAADVAEAADHGVDVQVFGAWPAFWERFTDRSGALRHLRARLVAAKYIMPVTYQYGALALILLVLLAASVSEAGGDVGQFAAAALLLLRSVQYGQQLQRALQQIAESVPRVEVMRRELEVPAPRIIPGARELDKIDRLEFNDVSYCYPGSREAALDGVSFVLRPGTIVGIAGPSGSGKSTLAQILLRIRWPTTGRYLVNGQEADVYSASSWHRLVSHVPQEPRLLHASLADNVTFFDDEILRDRIAATLTAVGLRGLISVLPGGMDAQLGPSERGLSGGQVQRLGIARALVRQPSLVVLDEPTSALDVAAERVVGDALTALRADPSVLVVVIAHRATTLALCDEMIVLGDGRVAAAGRSEEIVQANQFLAATWGVD